MIVGIDFGTTNSLIAYVGKDLKPQIIVNERGSRITPSVVYFKNEKQVLVGELAKSQMLIRPDQTIFKVKRKMGTDHRYTIFKESYTPSEIGSLIFRKLKAYATDFLGKPVTKAVVTVPAYFDDNQRLAVLTSAQLAGIEVVKLFNEPTAAALAYDVKADGERMVLVLDFGGGTFDITLMKHREGLFEVIATGGSTSLGGTDFDQVISNWVIETIKQTRGIDLSKDPIAMQQVINHSERAKVDLSTVAETSVVIPYIATSSEGPVHVNLTISRDQFENLARSLLDESERLILSTVKEAGIKPDQVNVVVLAGGSSRMPAFKKIASKHFPKAQVMSEVNSDEVVALGAAVQAAIIEGRLKNIELKDILPHSLGVLDDDGQFVPIIERGTAYPELSTRMFTNSRDNQSDVTIKVLQKRENQFIELGDFQFISSKIWQKGEANIAVSFQINNNGVLDVSAEDVDSGEVQDLRIMNGLVGVRDVEIQPRREELEKRLQVL